MGTTKVTTYLKCNHQLQFYIAASVGEEMWCAKCQKYEPVVIPAGKQFVKCSNCKFSRSFTNSPIAADECAVKHKNRYHSHTVVVWDGDAISHSYVGTLQATLPIDSMKSLDTDVPF